MTRFTGWYDPRVLEAVAAVFDISLVQSTTNEVQTRQVTIRELRVGAILAAAARTRDGVLIVPPGTQISPMLMQKLRNFAELRDLEEPLQVAG